GTCLVAGAPDKARDLFARAYGVFRRRQERRGVFSAWSAEVETIAMEWADFAALDAWIRRGKKALAELGPLPTGALAARFVAAMVAALLWRPTSRRDLNEWIERLLSELTTVDDDAERIRLGCNLLAYYPVCIGDARALDEIRHRCEPRGPL